MKSCTFFGYEAAPHTVVPYLEQAVLELITEEHVRQFYFQFQGTFEIAVDRVLQSMRCRYPDIAVYWVNRTKPSSDYAPLLPPPGIDDVPYEERSDWLNQWMLAQAQYVITYVPKTRTRARGYKSLAVDMGKIVIELADRMCTN